MRTAIYAILVPTLVPKNISIRVMHKKIINLILLSIILCCSQVCYAQSTARDYWRLCPGDRQLPPRPLYSSDNIEPGSTEVRADATRIEKDGLTHFSGDVEVIKGPRSLFGQIVTYDDASGLFDVEGDAHIWDAGLIWHGEHAAFDLNADTQRLDSGEYWLVNGRGRGFADVIKNNSVDNVSRLAGVEYTTCALSNPLWKFSAEKIKLDHDAGRGSATHAVLKVKDVPVFYLPYINFPLNDDRKTGFLMPTIGTSNESGFDFRIPFYINIAPNHDATLRPRILAERGVMLGGEYRYLQQNYEGNFSFEYLPSDKLNNDNDRSLVSLDHFHWFDDRRGTADVRIENVSDAQYFEDFGRSLSVTSQRFLDRKIDIRHIGNKFDTYGIVQSYQVVDDSLPPGSGPYERLPQLTMYSKLQGGHLQLSPQVNGQVSYFNRDTRVSGTRVDIEPSISFPYYKSYAQVIPKLAVRHTEYFLNGEDGFRDRESRTLPVFSLDGQLFAERRVSIFGTRVLQTFEPRAMYLYIPKDGQDDIPIFDSGLYDINFQSLFYHNRFSGRDRIGDTNQIALAASSRIISLESGREILRGSIGQIYYLQDREITLPGREKDKDDVSEIVAELRTNINRAWSTRFALQWDPNDSSTRKANAFVRYQPGNGTIVNAGYRQRRAVTDVEQTDFSFRVPLNDSLAVVGRWNYSLQNDRTLEAVGGFEYESCCWGMRLVSRRFLRNTEGEFDNAVFLQFVFKGLAGYGGSTGSFLRKSIPGYETYF